MTTRPTNIAAFIRERLEEERAAALAASEAAGSPDWEPGTESETHGTVWTSPRDAMPLADGPTEWQPLDPAIAVHMARHDPARVLRDVEADLAILFEHDEVECCSTCLDDIDGCPTFRALAYKHAGHPDWQPHWKPEESR